MPFGLKRVSVIFQRLIIKVLRSYLYEFVIMYLNNIIIFSNIMEEYFQYIKKILEVLRKAGLKLKLKKYKFAKKQLKYFRFIIGKFEIKSDLKKVNVIKAPLDFFRRLGLDFFSSVAADSKPLIF